MTTLAQIKSTVQPGQVYTVTNHYITRPDHPGYGTTRRTVTRTTGARIYMAQEGRREAEIDWPKAAQVQMDPDGTIRLYGGGIGQQPDELFLTLAPAPAFTLDGERAPGWLAGAVSAEVVEDGLPSIKAGWRPADDEHSGTVTELLDTAEAAGILRCPPGWRVGYGYAGDADGDGYRWFLASTDRDRPLTIAGEFSSTWPTATGAEAALKLLREAIAAGNALLATLDRHTGPGPAGASQPPSRAS